MLEIIVKDEDYFGLRLDKFIRIHYPNIVQSTIEKSLRKGWIQINDKKRTLSSYRLQEGDIVKIQEFLLEDDKMVEPSVKQKPKVSEKKSEFLLNSVLFKNKDIIVINKPIGIAVQGGSKIHVSIDDMLDVLKFEYKEAPRLTHRLDKDTSGVLILARNRKAATRITQYFRENKIQKTYRAVCKGVPNKIQGIIHAPIEVDGEMKEAITEYNVLAKYNNLASLIEFRPITGRKHQIRIHASKRLNTPIIGDGKYGGEMAFIDGVSIKLHLHAYNVKFIDENDLIDVTAPIYPHMLETFRILGFEKYKNE